MLQSGRTCKKYASIDPDFANKMLKSFYIDDFSGGTETIEELWELYLKGKESMRKSYVNEDQTTMNFSKD